ALRTRAAGLIQGIDNVSTSLRSFGSARYSTSRRSLSTTTRTRCASIRAWDCKASDERNCDVWGSAIAMTEQPIDPAFFETSIPGAKLVELFDAHGVSFVSVTQAFNTTTSMGRLTLNVLLSFAQFEREVTSERIR